MQSLESLVYVRPGQSGWQFSEDGREWVRLSLSGPERVSACEALEAATKLFPRKMVTICAKSEA